MTRRGFLLFAAMGLIWGLPYLLIKVAVRAVEPSVLVLARTAIGAALLLPVAIRRRELGPVLRRWKPLVIYTAIEIAGPWLLLSTAEKRVSSSLAGLLVSAVPLVGAVLSLALRDGQEVNARMGAGLVLGVAGVAALVGLDVHRTDMGAVAMIGVVVVCYAVGPVILVRTLADLPSLGVVAVSLALCALVYAPIGALQWPSHAPPARPLFALVVLGVVCTAIAFVLFFHLIAEAGPLRATVITYVNPAVAVTLGVVFLHEKFKASTALGFGLILAGSFLATGRRRAPEAGPMVAAIPEP
ncbi:MAG: EamA family transporter [Actinobacteria bacterium]|nr:EamA family transporter [Actinomycetota bacterium]